LKKGENCTECILVFYDQSIHVSLDQSVSMVDSEAE